MNTIKISIILPALNSIDYIRQCVDSILAQTFKEFELLCIDAGSTDGTLEAFREYAAKDSRVRLLHSDMRSYGHQVNMGMDEARGDYIGIVESDDFIDSHMYEALYRLSRNGTIDVAKANFYDYFDYPGMTPIPAPNGERRHMPPNGTVFKVNDYPHILEGHPSIWSGIYRLAFLRKNNIRFLELPGGGWTDNPFFFETLCSAESISWSGKPYYYYRKTNPNSSSNKMPDLTLPIRRMMDNLDVVEKYELNDSALQKVYERAVIYLNGSIIDSAYTSQENEIREWAAKLYQRLNERIVDKKLRGWFQFMYYHYLSPLMLKRPRSGRVLIYDYMPEDVNNRFVFLSEERKAQIRQLLSARYDVDVYLLTVRNSLEPDKPYGRIEKVFNRLSQQLFAFEVVNSPSLTQEMFEQFSSLFGPFEGEYFVSEKGLEPELIRYLEENKGLKVVPSFSHLMEIVKKLPEHEDITLTSMEYRQILRENDYFHRLMEENTYGDLLETKPYKLLLKGYKITRKIRGAILCCQQHGIRYTINLFLRRGH